MKVILRGLAYFELTNRNSDMTNTIAAILCMYKIEPRMQISREIRESHASPIMFHNTAERTKIRIKMLERRLNYLYSRVPCTNHTTFSPI
jgi:hypothetical protein